ncbi:MAG: bifunctional glutamate N-acetyltransferase/amino-acid acetyltransferase ArgJ [Proteobacteria bacterium]|nr:bifunctional glutamate N-acetyltransferase/amino-acid acetyltransferase ArgJ [Pseudomonadota bacterium]
MPTHLRSPLAPKTGLKVYPVHGVRLATQATGLRYKGRDDFLLAVFAEGTSVAGVFTLSLASAAPVRWCRKILGQGRARALLVNAGNANAATGKPGEALAVQSARAVAAALKTSPSQVYLASTGIIGQPLPKNALAHFVPGAVKKLSNKPSSAPWQKAGCAIMTTDTFPKVVSRHAKIGGKTVTITGLAKGSGMIAPNMATLLAFMFTDAAIPAPVLQTLLKSGVAGSFNAITVDSDTSTNDTLLAFATGAVAHAKISSATDAKLRDFTRVFQEVLVELAQLVVRDGEGAQKFITIDVTGALNDKAAHNIAMAIANSPLVKTALAASDANWGRILAAAARSGEKMNQDRFKVSMGGIPICHDGGLLKNYNEAPVARHLKGREITLVFDAGVGKGKARVWTCDLTHGYIEINAGYRS